MQQAAASSRLGVLRRSCSSLQPPVGAQLQLLRPAISVSAQQAPVWRRSQQQQPCTHTPAAWHHVAAAAAAAAARGARSVRCCSTARPQGGRSSAGEDRGGGIPWLCNVQRLVPSSSSDPNNTNGSNGSSASNGGSSTRLQPQYCDQALTEADLAGAAGDVDAIMVLAGGLKRDGSLPEWVHRRLDVARGLHLLQGRRPPIVCLGGGTPHKPDVLGPSGHVVHESTSCASYLMATGVQPDAILKEVSSYDTVGNAYFSLAIHALPAGWRRLAVVTSDFHMPRSAALFAGVYARAGDSLFDDPNRFSLTFLSASDEGVFDDHVYAARQAKEAESLAAWTRVAPSLPDLQAFHSWLFSDHLCYAVPRQGEFGKRQIADQALLDSY